MSQSQTEAVAVSGADIKRRVSGGWSVQLERFGVPIAWVLVFALFSILVPATFPTSDSSAPSTSQTR